MSPWKRTIREAMDAEGVEAFVERSGVPRKTLYRAIAPGVVPRRRTVERLERAVRERRQG